MIFVTPWFLGFIAITLPAFRVFCPGRFRRHLLLLASVIFHAHFAGPAGVAPIIVIGLCVYAAAIYCARANKTQHVRAKRLGDLIYRLVFLLPIVALIFYKYMGFLEDLFHFRGSFNYAAPLAISFFTFEFIHYLTDVRAGSAPITNFIDYWLFILFFPTIASGPIKRYENFVPQIRKLVSARLGSDEAAYGVFRIASGLFKKLIVGEWCVQAVHEIEPWFHYKNLAPSELVYLIFLQGIRIYADFSGYSDIAIGLARLFGITVPENFNFPYSARNPKDFWNRWHMSLTSWIGDYFFIPFARKWGVFGEPGLLMALFGAMAIIGLWHGPAIHFLMYGLYHGCGLALQDPLGRLSTRLGMGRLLRRVLAQASTLVFVFYGYLLFFYTWTDTQWITLRILNLN